MILSPVKISRYVYTYINTKTYILSFLFFLIVPNFNTSDFLTLRHLVQLGPISNPIVCGSAELPMNSPFASFTMLYLCFKFIPFSVFPSKKPIIAQIPKLWNLLEEKRSHNGWYHPPPLFTWSSALSLAAFCSTACQGPTAFCLTRLVVWKSLQECSSVSWDNCFSWRVARVCGPCQLGLPS